MGHSVPRAPSRPGEALTAYGNKPGNELGRLALVFGVPPYGRIDVMEAFLSLRLAPQRAVRSFVTLNHAVHLSLLALPFSCITLPCEQSWTDPSPGLTQVLDCPAPPGTAQL